jgi:hypothetical protein
MGKLQSPIANVTTDCTTENVEEVNLAITNDVARHVNVLNTIEHSTTIPIPAVVGASATASASATPESGQTFEALIDLCSPTKSQQIGNDLRSPTKAVSEQMYDGNSPTTPTYAQPVNTGISHIKRVCSFSFPNILIIF